MRRFLCFCLSFFLIIIATAGCSQVDVQFQPTTEPATGMLATDPEIAGKLQAASLQVGDLPADYRLTISKATPAVSDIPEDSEQGLNGFLLRQFESLGKMTVISTLFSYGNEEAASKAFELLKEGVETYSNELKINGISGDSLGRQESFKIANLTQSNASYAFRQGKFIATFLFINPSGNLDQSLMEKTINLVFKRIQKIF